VTTLDRVEDEMLRIVDEARRRGVLLRVIGGLAVRAHCPSANHASLERVYPDIDLVTPRDQARHLADLMRGLAYLPNKTFNTLNGDRRQLYYDDVRIRQVDIFIGEFDMAHRIPLSERLHMEPVTVPLAELFLSKAQIVEINQKDVLDLLALLLDHGVGAFDDETINLDIVAGLCASDWGLYTTVSMTLERLRSVLARGDVELDATRKETVRGRVESVQDSIDAAPKTLAWKMRARVGKRLRWYQEVEEVQR
jgi:hypothetical protein